MYFLVFLLGHWACIYGIWIVYIFLIGTDGVGLRLHGTYVQRHVEGHGRCFISGPGLADAGDVALAIVGVLAYWGDAAVSWHTSSSSSITYETRRAGGNDWQ